MSTWKFHPRKLPSRKIASQKIATQENCLPPASMILWIFSYQLFFYYNFILFNNNY